MQYENIFFDLDHTLWDLETNSRETLTELIIEHKLLEIGVNSPDDFIRAYHRINDRMWDEYRKGLIDKEKLRYARFLEAMQIFGINDKELAEQFGADYVKRGPLKKNLFPHTIEVLSYLQNKYSLHIITNGFEEVQHIKLTHSGLSPFFKHIITSEAAGYKKPDIRIFDYALGTTKASATSSLMIGDNMETDIVGARDSGINQVFFNPNEIKHDEKITHEITSLNQLFEIL